MKNYRCFFFFLLLVMFSSCAKENTETYIRNVLNEWNVAVSAKNMLPANATLQDTGTVRFILLSDNSLVFELTIKNITGNDNLTGIRLKAGDAVTNGTTLLDLTAITKFHGTLGANTYAQGAFSGLRQSLVDSLMDNSTHLYLELLSQQYQRGYVRGQLNERIVFSTDIELEGRFQVPSVSTNASATAWLRLTSNKKLYSRITTMGNEPSDPLKTAHIQRAAIGQNGPIVFTLAETAQTSTNQKRLF